jgi:hypothetical protein
MANHKVFFVGCEKRNTVYIDFTTNSNLSKMFELAQKYCDEELQLLADIPCPSRAKASTLYRGICSKLKDFHKRGSWFVHTPELTSIIDKIESGTFKTHEYAAESDPYSLNLSDFENITSLQDLVENKLNLSVNELSTTIGLALYKVEMYLRHDYDIKLYILQGLMRAVGCNIFLYGEKVEGIPGGFYLYKSINPHATKFRSLALLRAKASLDVPTSLRVIENQDSDVNISDIYRYIKALGGELHVIVRLPTKERVTLFGDAIPEKVTTRRRRLQAVK